MAILDFLSCIAIVGMMIQLLYMLHSCASSNGLQAMSHPRVLASLHSLEHFFTLSHTLPLHDSHLNIGLLIAKLQEIWHRIKPTRWLIKFNLTTLIYGLLGCFMMTWEELMDKTSTTTMGYDIWNEIPEQENNQTSTRGETLQTPSKWPNTQKWGETLRTPRY